MNRYLVVAESYDEERSQRFSVDADSKEKAWAKAYFQCGQISQNTGTYWTPVDIQLAE